MASVVRTVETILSRMPEDVRSLVQEKTIRTLDQATAAETAGRITTGPEALEMLAQSSSATVRTAVARNLNCPEQVLSTLAKDKVKSVSDAAKRRLLWLEVSVEGAPVPKHTKATARQIETFLVEDHPWAVVPGATTVLGKLLREDAWLADARFVRLCYETLAEVDTELLLSAGPSRFMRALLATMPDRDDCENALEWLWEQLPMENFLQALQDNEDLLVRRVVDEAGPEWKQLPFDADDGCQPHAWYRLGLKQCPDGNLFDAFHSDIEMVVELAAAAARQRPHLQNKIVNYVTAGWHEYSGFPLQLIDALDDDALLDLPVELIVTIQGYQGSDEREERARIVLAHAASDIVRERPEAWTTLQVLAEDYEGTARELLSAMRNL